MRIPGLEKRTFRALTPYLLALALAGCAPTEELAPLRAAPAAPEELTLVWVGRGECERFEDGKWVRRPEFDYEFTVEQRRSGAHWESVKSLRRLHPDYDGSAGPRSQTYFFLVDYAETTPDGRVRGAVRSSLGAGVVATDPEFRGAVVDLEAPTSRWAPFDRYRIRQTYRYENGELDETVELNNGEAPWVRNRERATLFARARFEAPPTHRPPAGAPGNLTETP